MGRAFLLISLVFMSLACSSGTQRISTSPLPGRKPVIKAIAVMMPEYYHGRMKSHEVYDKAEDALLYMSRRTGLPMVLFDELRILADDVVTDIRNQTNLFQVLESFSVSEDQALAVQFTLTQQTQQDNAVITKQNKKGSASRSGYSASLQLTIDITHVGTNRNLLSLFMSRTVDPFNARLYDYDERPWNRQLLLDGMAAAMDKLEELVDFAPGVRGPEDLVVLESPAAAASFAYKNLPTLRSELVQKGALLKEVEMIRRAQYRHHDESQPVLMKLAGMEKGLLVGGAPSCSGLARGDVVLEAQGEAVDRIHEWRRILWSNRGDLALTVLRGGARQNVTWRCR